MKLTATQREYLLRLTRGPQWLANRSTPWWHDLWTRDLIMTVGNSVYITEAGRALAEAHMKIDEVLAWADALPDAPGLADGGAQE